GVLLDPATGVVSGTPTSTSKVDITYAFIIRATNAAGAANFSTSVLMAVPIISVIEVRPASLTFGNQRVDSVSAAQRVTVSNTGNGPFTIRGYTTSGDFGYQTTCPVTLEPLATCTIDVTFKPLTAVALTGQIVIDNTALEGASTVTLSGTGVAVPRANIIVAPSSLTFGDQALGTSANPQAIVISNTGLDIMELRGLLLTGAAFAQVPSLAADNTRGLPSCGSTVAIAASCIVGINFTPLIVGSASGSFTITHNATPTGVSGTTTVAIVGNGTPRREPLIRLSSGLSFGEQVLNTTSTPQPVVVTNVGTADLVVGAINVTSNNALTSAAEFPVAHACGTLIPNANCVVTVNFAPVGVVGTKSAAMNVSSNAANLAVATATLTGTALPLPVPLVRLSATSIGYGTVILGGPAATQRITVTNGGVQPLVINNATTTGDFAQANDCNRELGPNQSCTIILSFGPLLIGNRSGTLSITSNAPSSPDNVSLGGNGCALVPPVARRFFIGSSCSN
ncbi:MAG: choice-of-anchor D domain-containing protein, partial [Aeromicrobium sp.]|nr:choice-of-anchor D domain-containing protein [Burkholderiales bacterium]